MWRIWTTSPRWVLHAGCKPGGCTPPCASSQHVGAALSAARPACKVLLPLSWGSRQVRLLHHAQPPIVHQHLLLPRQPPPGGRAA